jgi:hypothetical protein
LGPDLLVTYAKAAKDFREKIVSCADAQETNAAARAREFGIEVQTVDQCRLYQKLVDDLEELVGAVGLKAT